MRAERFPSPPRSWCRTKGGHYAVIPLVTGAALLDAARGRRNAQGCGGRRRSQDVRGVVFALSLGQDQAAGQQAFDEGAVEGNDRTDDRSGRRGVKGEKAGTAGLPRPYSWTGGNRNV